MTTLPATYYGEGLYGEGYYVEGKSQNRETAIVNKTLTPLPPPVFTGMKLQEDVIFGDLVLNAIDENNVIWVCTDIEGWWDLPDPDIPDVTRGWRDGSYDARGRWQARQMTLNGVILPPDPGFLPAARASLINAANLVYNGTWLKTNENPTRASFVRLSGRPEIATVNARGRTEFSIGLRAADPVKYSWNDSDPDGYNSVALPCKNVATSATGETVITNVGNTSVSIFLEVTGPIVGPAKITNLTTNEVLTIVSPLISTDELEIDTYEREVAFNGDTIGARVKLDVLVDWLTLSPGANTIRFIDEGAANSTASLVVYYRSGWIG
jgi:hypothetical protein